LRRIGHVTVAVPILLAARVMLKPGLSGLIGKHQSAISFYGVSKSQRSKKFSFALELASLVSGGP
jgi:hypothetical protein